MERVVRIEATGNAPFGNCKTAQLQLIDRVQCFGGLAAIDKRSQQICACSANIEEFTGKRADELLGEHWTSAFRTSQLIDLFNAGAAPGQQLAHIQRTELNGRAVLMATHSVENRALVEIEHHRQEPQQFDFADRVGYLQALAGTDSPEAAAGLLMDSVAGLTRFDRVMLYKFLPEWHGEVIAERLNPGMQGYLGLRFPATDLPANVRRLYMVNWQRIIADVQAQTVPLLMSPDCEAIDLSFAQLRAVHPVHIQYLKNLGVEASFSVSIVVAGRLWGLVVCHHLTAKTISLQRRQLCEEVARTTAMHMSNMQALRIERRRAELRERLAEVLGVLRAQSANKRSIVSQLAQIRQVYRAQGILAHLDDRDFHNGVLPDDLSLSALQNSLATFDNTSVTARRTILPALATHPALVRFASGTLYVPLNGRDYLLLMRPEQIETVSWAGRPQGHADADDEIAQLTPRASFQSWAELVKRTSEAWEDTEIESAARLRELLIEYVEKSALEDLALHDSLTGLANRLMFERSLNEAITLAIRDDKPVAVFMLDLDKFKAINDTMGHAAGDAVLIEVARRLTGLMRARDTVARLGGDEFGIVALDVKRAQDADCTAERIIKEIQRPFVLDGHSVEIGVSIGVSMCPLDAVERVELLDNADLALYKAKGAGRNTFKSFTNDMVSAADQRESVRDGLIEAMHDGSLFLAYQPIVGSASRALHSFETFARWEHPAKGELAARDILPLIEQCQLLAPFAEWGIRQALQQGKLWMREAVALVPVSLNLTARQFLTLDLVGLCGSLARELDVGLEWLRFDLDETALQSDFPRAAEKIAALCRIGVLINIDHFGQGLVPLNRICDVKINELKISGRNFGIAAEANRFDALVAILREVGRVLNVPIAATQIETEAMALRATAAGIDYLQGYLISRELQPEAASAWLRTKMAPA